MPDPRMLPDQSRFVVEKPPTMPWKVVEIRDGVRYFKGYVTAGKDAAVQKAERLALARVGATVEVASDEQQSSTEDR